MYKAHFEIVYSINYASHDRADSIMYGAGTKRPDIIIVHIILCLFSNVYL